MLTGLLVVGIVGALGFFAYDIFVGRPRKIRRDREARLRAADQTYRRWDGGSAGAPPWRPNSPWWNHPEDYEDQS